MLESDPPPCDRKSDLATADRQEGERRGLTGSEQGVHSTAASDPPFSLGTLPTVQPSAEVDLSQLGGKRRGGNWRSDERAHGGVTTSSDAPLPKSRPRSGSVHAVLQQHLMMGTTSTRTRASLGDGAAAQVLYMYV